MGEKAIAFIRITGIFTVSDQLTKGQRSLENGLFFVFFFSFSTCRDYCWFFPPKAIFFGGIPSIGGWSQNRIAFFLVLCGKARKDWGKKSIFLHTFMIYEKLIYSPQLDNHESEKCSYNKVAVSFLK